MKCHHWLKQTLLVTNVVAFTLLGTSLDASYKLEPIASFNSSIPGSPDFKDGYGATVRFNNDWVFVSAPIARPDNKVIAGAVYVYKKSATGYEQTQIITTSGTSDHLGLFEIISNDDWLYVSLIGTPQGNIPEDLAENQDYAGSVQIYHLENGQWIHHSSLDNSTPGLEELTYISAGGRNPMLNPFYHEQGANFGLNFSLNWEHRVLLVGAQYQANLNPVTTDALINVGAAYAFHFNDETKKWVLAQKITNPEGFFENDVFGSYVATDGNYALVSNSPLFQLSKHTNTAVYVYKRIQCGRWEYVQKLTGDQTNSTWASLVIPFGFHLPLHQGDAFGSGLILKDGRAIITASLENLGTSSIKGAAYFYQLNSNGLFERVFKATSSDPNSQRFGFPTVRLDNDKVYISDTNYSGDAGTSQGAIAVYSFNNEQWNFEGNLLSPNALPFEFFGESFDVKDNIIGVGTGLFNSGFISRVVGTPPIKVPMPYPEHTPFTIFKIEPDK